jgi:hypothetical protein
MMVKAARRTGTRIVVVSWAVFCPGFHMYRIISRYSDLRLLP